MIRLKRNDQIGLFFFIAFVVSITLIFIFEEKFDTELWLSSPGQRYKMVDDILENNYLMDKSKEEIYELLGEPESYSNISENVLLYPLGTPPSFFNSKENQLLIVFKNGKVSKVSLAVEK